MALVGRYFSFVANQVVLFVVIVVYMIIFARDFYMCLFLAVVVEMCMCGCVFSSATVIFHRRF